MQAYRRATMTYLGYMPRMWFSSLAAPQEVCSSAQSLRQGEGVLLDTLALLRPGDRHWAASTALGGGDVEGLLGVKPATVAVLRDAFTVHSQPERPLRSILKQTASNSLALHSSILAPSQRVLADHYRVTPSGDYALVAPSTDLPRLLHRHNVHMRVAPDLQQPLQPAAAEARQSTNEVLMVAPTAFEYNSDTAADNTFMHKPDGGFAATVLSEFADLHHELSERHGVRVSLMQHDAAHGTPDAVFPNNWFSTHAAREAAGGGRGSTLVLYPMKAPSRAAERRPELLQLLRARGYDDELDYSVLEGPAGAGGDAGGVAFEGTGVLVLDRVNRRAYVALSERAERSVAERWVQDLGYDDLVTFHTRDASGGVIYHTNVMMAIGSGVAVVCSASVPDDKERRHLLERLSATHEVVDISLPQMNAMCGNCLELLDGRGLPIMAMSSRAFHAFTPEQLRTLRRHCADLAHAPIPTLEDIGGGSVRCCLGELF